MSIPNLASRMPAYLMPMWMRCLKPRSAAPYVPDRFRVDIVFVGKLDTGCRQALISQVLFVLKYFDGLLSRQDSSWSNFNSMLYLKTSSRF